MKIGVSLVNYHSNDDIKKIANKFASYPSISKIVIVDNDTQEKNRVELMFDDAKIDVIFEKDNLGYSKGNNIAIKRLIEDYRCDYIIVSNSDIEVDEDTIIKCVSVLKDCSQYGAVAPRMLDNEGNVVKERTLELGYLRVLLRILIKEQTIDKIFEKKHGNKHLIDQSFLPGSFFVASSKALIACNMFDPNIFLYREEECLNKRLMNANFKEALLFDRYYWHKHNYKKQDFKGEFASIKKEMKSEKYYFKKYREANVFQMVIIRILHGLYYVSKIFRYFIKKGIKLK